MARSAALLELADPGQAVWRALVDAVLADWPADVEGVLPAVPHPRPRRGAAADRPRPAVPGAGRGRAPAHRGHLGGEPRPRRARRLPRPGALAARRGEDAVLRGEHGRPAARALGRRRRRRLHLRSTGSSWKARRRRSSGPPVARCTRLRWRPGSCPAPPWRGCSTGRTTTAGRPRVIPGTVADLHAADAVWLLSGVRLPPSCTPWTASRAGTRGLTERIRALLARYSARCAGKSGRHVFPTPPRSSLTAAPAASRPRLLARDQPHRRGPAQGDRRRRPAARRRRRDRARLGQLPLGGRLRGLRDPEVGPDALHLHLTPRRVGRRRPAGDLLLRRRARAQARVRRRRPARPAPGGAAGRGRGRRDGGAGAALRRWSTSAPAPARCAAGRSPPRPTSRSRSPCSR